jgi:hypothetical protein
MARVYSDLQFTYFRGTPALDAMLCGAQVVIGPLRGLQSTYALFEIVRR